MHKKLRIGKGNCLVFKKMNILRKIRPFFAYFRAVAVLKKHYFVK